jgi:hypothetical protein
MSRFLWLSGCLFFHTTVLANANKHRPMTGNIFSSGVHPLHGGRFRTCAEWASLFSEQRSLLMQTAHLSERISSALSSFSSPETRSGAFILQARSAVETELERLRDTIEMAADTPVDEFFSLVDAEVSWIIPLEKFARAPGGELTPASLVRVSQGWDRIRALDAWGIFSLHDPISLKEIEDEGRFRARIGPGAGLEIALKVTPWERCLAEPGWGGIVAPTGAEKPVTPFFVSVDVSKEASFVDTRFPDGRQTVLSFGERQSFRLTMERTTPVSQPVSRPSCPTDPTSRHQSKPPPNCPH